MVVIQKLNFLTRCTIYCITFSTSLYVYYENLMSSEMTCTKEANCFFLNFGVPILLHKVCFMKEVSLHFV